MGVHYINVCCAERAFREQLYAMEMQLVSLQTSCEELGTHRKTGEKMERENNKLKSIIASQDENVSQFSLTSLSSLISLISLSLSLSLSLSSLSPLSLSHLMIMTGVFEGKML